jgi:hypothetical protein
MRLRATRWRRIWCHIADWFAELRELAGDRWPEVADQAPTVYAVWGGGATPPQALYMVGLILPPKTAAA